MPGFTDLHAELSRLITDEEKTVWLREQITQALQKISECRGGRNVILYASGFLQKPGAPSQTLQITHEDINGFMTAMHGMDFDRNLSLILHTPGGVTNATETIVEYLRSKFGDIEALIPTYAISAGTMISLASNRIVMGTHSQLGPIDSQMIIRGRGVSAQAIVDQFERAKSEVLKDQKAAHVWAPLLQSLGPALVEEARRALRYGEDMVCDWLANRMLSGQQHSVKKARAIAKHFNSSPKNSSHGRRIDRNEAAENGVVIEYLEEQPQLQEYLLTAYHVMTLIFEMSPAAKLIVTGDGRFWVKNLVSQQSKLAAHQ